MNSKAKTMLELMRGQRLRYGAAVAALLMGVVLLYAPPLVVRASIDGLLQNKGEGRLNPLILQVLSAAGGESLKGKLIAACVVIAAATGLSGLFMYLKGRWAALASETIAKKLRERLYDHLQHLPVSYHDKAQTGDLVQRCTSDVDTLRLFYSSQVIEIARAAILLVTVLPIVLLLDWRLGLIALSIMPVVVVFAIVYFARIAHTFKAADEAEGAMTATIQENLTGIRVVRAFARQEFEKGKFSEKNVKYRDLNYRLYKVLAIYWALSDFLCFSQTAVVLMAGAWRVSRGYTSVGTLVAFVSFVMLVIWPVRQMGRILSELSKAMVALGRIQEILQATREADAETASAAAPAALSGRMRFSNVSFSHGEKPILHDISFEVEQGQTIALLGPSGSGKSTLIQLLLRFYDYPAGSIELDGIELRNLDRRFVRRQFSVVMQEPFLYSKSLRENLRLGRHTASHDEVVEAATMASIHDSIEQFDKKYETLVGERGVTLSGGQRQRVAIARALLRDAPILVLDDALSAVDTRTETMILEALKRRRGRQTTLLIAHRLSTLKHADRIIVLENGRIIQSGPHDALIEQDGLYQRLWQIQTALEEDLTREMLENGALPQAAGAGIGSRARMPAQAAPTET